MFKEIRIREIRISWFKTILACSAGIMFIFLKLFYLGMPFMVFCNIINSIAYTRTSNFGVMHRVRKTIHQAPDLATELKYIKADYNKDRDKVSDMVAEDLKGLVLGSLKRCRTVYICTNNFVYKNVLLKMQEDGLIKVERLNGYKVPQVIEKVQIMNWGAVARCFWDMNALKRLFRMEEICKYRLEKVALYDKKEFLEEGQR